MIPEANKRYNHSEKGRIAGKLRARKARLKVKQECLEHYCQSLPHCMCKGCKVTTIALLDLHHVNGDGAAHRQLARGSGSKLYVWLRYRGYPSDWKLTVLCCNCHRAKTANVNCQH